MHLLRRIDVLQDGTQPSSRERIDYMTLLAVTVIGLNRPSQPIYFLQLPQRHPVRHQIREQCFHRSVTDLESYHPQMHRLSQKLHSESDVIPVFVDIGPVEDPVVFNVAGLLFEKILSVFVEA